MKENYIKICGEIARGLPEDTRGGVQFLGGITAAALGHPKTNFDPDAKVIEAPSDLYLSAERENGTKRDLDLLCLSTNPAKLQALGETVYCLVGGRLDFDKNIVFGLKSNEILQEQRRSPMGSSALKTIVSSRYCDDDGQVSRALFPFDIPVDWKSLEPWTLVVGKDEIPMPSPATTLLNYTQRSIGGLRPKDTKKWLAMHQNVARQSEIIDEIHDGKYAAQAELTKVLDSLRLNRPMSGSSLLGLGRYSNDELLKHKGFMVNTGYEQSMAQAVLMVARIKACGLGNLERFAGLWQKIGIEKLAGRLGLIS